MKTPLVLMVLFSAPMFVAAQNEQHDLRTLLQDSSYVFNRFEESTTGLDALIDDWDVPASGKSLFKRELSAVLKNVNTEKPNLNALLQGNKVSAADLFDVYSELTEVSGELFGQSSNLSNWGKDSSKALELSQLGAKANVLAANLGVVLRARIVAQETQLRACAIKAPLPAVQQQ